MTRPQNAKKSYVYDNDVLLIMFGSS